MKRVSPLLVVFVALLLVVQTGIVIKLTNDLVSDVGGIHARASSGFVGMCINYPPNLNVDCRYQINQSTAIVNNTYNCLLSIDNPYNLSVNYSYVQLFHPGLYFHVSPSGLLTIDANQSGIGLHLGSIIVTVGDDCPLSDSSSYLFQILDINDPPYQKINMPSTALREGSNLIYGYLTNYFADPDNDPLTFTVSPTQNFIITITNNSQIKITNPAKNCEDEYVYFTASDGELTFDGNMILLDAICDETVAGSSGGEGGFGCNPDWKCGRWSQCYYNGTRSRDCVDLAGCNPDDLEKTFWESCNYTETCFDGIQNQDETGVDCGGVCPACPVSPTCFDGIRNQGEEGVDCGGPCEPCVIIETCFDGIKNQGETGIDCGGPCEPCKEIQVPGIIETESNSLLIASMIAFLSVVGGVLGYLIFRKEIRSAYSKLSWWITRKRKKQFLLSDDDKDDLLKKIRKLEDEFSMSKVEMFRSDDPFILEVLDVNRLFFMKAFGFDREFTKENLTLKANKILFHSTLKHIYDSFMDKQILLERKKIGISRLHLSFMIQEIKGMVLEVSHYYKNDPFVAEKDYAITGGVMEKVTKLLHNAVVDLQFAETENARQKYLQIIGLYEQLSEKEKVAVYGEIARLFNHIRYSISWSEIKIN